MCWEAVGAHYYFDTKNRLSNIVLEKEEYVHALSNVPISSSLKCVFTKPKILGAHKEILTPPHLKLER